MASKQPKGPTPFDVKLSPEDKADLTNFLCDEITGAIEARGDRNARLTYAYTIYEQGRTRPVRKEPYVDGADLTSYLGTQYVDALTSRAVKTIFTEPIWTVEGVGKSAGRAPIVEEFHQWKAEQERLQMRFARAIRTALIEGRSALEVYEGSQLRKVRKTMRVKVETVPDPMTGEPLIQYDEEQKPKLLRDDVGGFVEVEEAEGEPPEPMAEVIVESWDRVRTGPQVRVLSNRDFLALPGHATQREDLWGWAKRFMKRIPELDERVKFGDYDKEAVAGLGKTSDADGSNPIGGREQTIAPQQTPDTSEKELWDVTFLRDLDDDGVQEWYIATISTLYRRMLRLKRDTLDQQRFVLLVPLTRAETELDGYSVILDKIGTIIEEHTVRRNMFADRAELVAGAPIKRLAGSTWHPEETPFGPRAVIDLDNMNEVEMFQMPDVPQSMHFLLGESIEAAERTLGLNDASMGQTPQQDRTLGEVRMVAGYSEIRVEEILMNLREPLEDLFQVRHAMYIRELEEEKGQPAPKDVMVGLERRLNDSDVTFEGTFTADLLRGNFRGKPRGSVESADLNVMRSDFNQFLQGLAQISQVNPAIQMMLSTPQAAAAMVEQALRVYRFPDRQAILGSAMQQATMQPGMVPGMPPQGALPPGQPGMAPPAGGMPPAQGGQAPAQGGQASPLAAGIAEAVMANLGGG